MKLPTAILDPSTAVEFPAGSAVFRIGDAGSDMFIVESGEVDIVADGMVIETVGPDGFFGEMALIDQSARSADAVVRSACRLLPVSRHKFIFMVDEVPMFALRVMQVMADRLRRSKNGAA